MATPAKRAKMDSEPGAVAGSGAAAGAAAEPDPVMNPYTGQQYSRRFHEILATRKTLPIWEHKAKVCSVL